MLLIIIITAVFIIIHFLLQQARQEDRKNGIHLSGTHYTIHGVLLDSVKNLFRKR